MKILFHLNFIMHKETLAAYVSSKCYKNYYNYSNVCYKSINRYINLIEAGGVISILQFRLVPNSLGT